MVTAANRIEHLLGQAGVPSNRLANLLQARRLPVLPVTRVSELTEIRAWLQIGNPVTRAIAPACTTSDWARCRDHSLREQVDHRPAQRVDGSWRSVERGPAGRGCVATTAGGTAANPWFRPSGDDYVPVEAAKQYLEGEWSRSVGRASYLFDVLDPDRPSARVSSRALRPIAFARPVIAGEAAGIRKRFQSGLSASQVLQCQGSELSEGRRGEGLARIMDLSVKLRRHYYRLSSCSLEIVPVRRYRDHEQHLHQP